MHLQLKPLSGNNMKFIKLGAISFVILFCLVTTLGLLFPSTVIVSRAIDVHANSDTLLHQITDMNQWKNWVKGMNGEYATVKNAHEGEMGKTHIAITLVEPKKIVSEWTGSNGKKQISTINLISNSPDVTVVQWEFREELSWYPWERFGSMMNDNILGPGMEFNLNALKELVEKKDQ